MSRQTARKATESVLGVLGRVLASAAYGWAGLVLAAVAMARSFDLPVRPLLLVSGILIGADVLVRYRPDKIIRNVRASVLTPRPSVPRPVRTHRRTRRLS